MHCQTWETADCDVDDRELWHQIESFPHTFQPMKLVGRTAREPPTWYCLTNYSGLRNRAPGFHHVMQVL